jgi:hypothetical protein
VQGLWSRDDVYREQELVYAACSVGRGALCSHSVTLTGAKRQCSSSNNCGSRKRLV